MKRLLATIDRAAEHMEKAGHCALAAVLDSVSEEMAKRNGDEYACANGTCADGTCADDDGVCPDGSVATASFRSHDSTTPPLNASAILANNASRLFESVKRYGAKAYRVDSDSVEVQLDRDGVETTAEFQFCSRDEAGNPQLRLTFRCGDAKMVRWASLDRLGGDELVSAATHVFGTGQNYGKHVVVAETAKPKLTYRLVDSIEQVVHVTKRTSLATVLAKFDSETLQRALPHLDAWTRRHVSSYLAKA